MLNKPEIETFDEVMARIQYFIINCSVNPEDADAYKTILDKTVFEVSQFGLRREEIVGFVDADGDLPHVVEGLDLITQDIALKFKKTYRVVEKDMMRAFSDFPTEDMKLSFYLSKHNKLH